MERSRNLSREAWESLAFKRGEDVNTPADVVQFILFHHSLSQEHPSRKLPMGRIRLAVAIGCATIAASSLAIYTMRRPPAAVQSVPASVKPVAQSVTALGRLEPMGEVIRLAASSQGSRVVELRVKQGDRVQVGQIIAVLDSRDRHSQIALRQPC
jgi:HlyD family secretion protein